jgi:AraC family transcriptional regulator
MSRNLLEGHYYGKSVLNLHANGLFLSECRYAPKTKVPEHSHKNPYFNVALEGSQDEDFGEGTRSYRAWTVAFHPAGEVHSEVIGPFGMSCLHVEFSTAWLQGHHLGAEVVRCPRHFEGNQLDWVGLQIYREFVESDDASPLAIEGLVLETLAKVSRRSTGRMEGSVPPWLKQAHDILLDNYADAHSLTELATTVGVHPVHLARAFRRHYHSSVGEYLRRLRIDASCRAILHSKAPLSQIALGAGFADQAHFTRTFKRLIGMTPSEFRQMSVR